MGTAAPWCHPFHGQYSGYKSVSATVTKQVDQHYLLHHDFLQCYAKGGLGNSSEATRLFAMNHYQYSRNFIKYLTMVKDKLNDTESASLISENMSEENGSYEGEDLTTLEKHGVPRDQVNHMKHKALIKNFLGKVGVTEQQLEGRDGQA